jgi:predicted ester cyclase
MKVFKKISLITAISFFVIGLQMARAETQINDNDLVKPQSMTIDQSIDKTQAEQMVRAARLFYTFWNTGDSIYLDAVISPKFIDNTLPNGRPQGPDGLKFASVNFRKAVPDLTCSLKDLLVVGDKITARMVFHGTFKGEFMNHAPTNKPIEFFAIDILQIKNGRLVEDWHLEDNLTLMQQLDAVKIQ